MQLLDTKKIEFFINIVGLIDSNHHGHHESVEIIHDLAIGIVLYKSLTVKRYISPIASLQSRITQIYNKQ